MKSRITAEINCMQNLRPFFLYYFNNQRSYEQIKITVEFSMLKRFKNTLNNLFINCKLIMFYWWKKMLNVIFHTLKLRAFHLYINNQRNYAQSKIKAELNMWEKFKNIINNFFDSKNNEHFSTSKIDHVLTCDSIISNVMNN